jgi:hypothetical protein
MARPESNTVSYFPFYCEEGKKMHYLEETYGNDGFATFVKLLRELAKTDNHYLDLSQNTTSMFLAAKCKISKLTLELIVNDLVELGKFDRFLWEESKVIWCNDFVNSIQDAYSKRKSKCITYQGLLSLLSSLGVLKLDKLPIKGDINTQSKVKEIKVNKSKEVKGVFTPPSFIDFENYCKENGFQNIAERAFKGYSENYWKDSKNNPVLNWKSKLQNVWFNDSNKDKKTEENPMIENDKIYYRWEKEDKSIRRSIDKERAESYFANQKQGGYIAIIL